MTDPQTTKIISQIHEHNDYQTQNYAVGRHGVISIIRFNIKGMYEMFPRLRVNFENGSTVEMDEHGMVIYETEVQKSESKTTELTTS